MLPQEIAGSLKSFFQEKFQKILQIHQAESLSGGSINHVVRLTTNLGDFCLKYNYANTSPGMFDREAKGLLLLKNAREIKVPAPIYNGIAGQYSFLLLEFIVPARRIPHFMKDFGQSLARLHRHNSVLFGLDHDNYMGSMPQSNRNHDDFISFFVEERLEKQVAIARNKGYFPASDIKRFQRLYQQLGQIIPGEKPCLVHGDLWGGNYIVSGEGTACLIDPAVYYGHREVDIAMSHLFGGFDTDFYMAYNETFPLEKGWEGRIDIFNLYPLLIHLNLFGMSYLGSIEHIIRKF